MVINMDIVVLWVDGDDPQWLSERAKFAPVDNSEAVAQVRFRDWGLMRYWFRGVEKFAPWANNVYFVTWGHYPEWLNLENPKLKIIKHDDYIPQEYLPTFNSNVIELNLHRISELGEEFVLFNDDMFLLRPVKEADFFKKGLPCDMVRLGNVYSSSPEEVFAHTILNNVAIINKHFCKKQVERKYWRKFYSLKYGKHLVRNMLLFPFSYFSSFYDSHLPTSHLKSTFFEVWGKEQAFLENCGYHRFRDAKDATHWLFKCWRFCQGRFIPRGNNWGGFFDIDSGDAIKAIENQKYKAVCLNDNSLCINFEETQKKVIAAFEKVLPEKSSFEK